MRQFSTISDDKPKKVKVILVLLGLVIVGGVASLIINGSSGDDQAQEEEFQFVEFAPPPPPPPPPPAPDQPEPDPEEFDEPLEPVEIPEDAEVSPDEPVNDLGLDLGEMAMGEGAGGGFVMDIPRFGRRGRGGDSEGDELMEGAGASEAAIPTFKVQPTYPSALLRKKIGGKVVVAATVDSSGAVIKVMIKQSSGHAELDKAVVTAIQKWKFKPGAREGKPVQSTCLIPYTFEVKNN
ncbi:MAG: energy transducer TonB [Akkermansiaceae bacterium]